MDAVAAVLEEVGMPLVMRAVSVPAPAAGQVLVEIAYSGVCHTQLLEVRGQRGVDPYLPHVLGHEASGTVLALGDGVSKVSTGDRVVLSWIKGIGADAGGITYEDGDAGTQINGGPIATFMTHAVISENRVTAIPSEMPMREASLLGCAFPTGSGAVMNDADVRAGESVAIFGLGGVGVSAVIAAAQRKASHVIAVDTVEEKLDFVRDLGATHAVSARGVDVAATIRELTNGEGVDYAIECAGHPAAMELAFQSVRDGGGLCVIVGNLPNGQTIEIDPMALILGKRITASRGGGTIPDEDFPKYADQFIAGGLPLGKLISHEYALADVNRAIDDLERGNVVRAVLDMRAGG